MTSDAVVLLIAVFGLLLLALACQRLFRARFVAAAGSGLMGALLLAGAALFFVVSLNLHTYNRLTYEQAVAEIVFEGPRMTGVSLLPVEIVGTAPRLAGVKPVSGFGGLAAK